MGVGIAAVKLNLELWQRGLLKNVHSVLDMGAQELALKSVDLEKLVREACVPGYRKENFPNLDNWPGRRPRCPAKPFYEMLGIKKYSCIDLGGHQDAIYLDLNKPLEDTLLYNQYDLVTDYGNNEHVFNVAEAYRTMHRLCKENGSMIIMQVVYRGNGYYLYEPSFFEGMAAANGYQILFSSYVVSPGGSITANQYHVPLSNELLDILDWTKTETIGICYVMQKQTNSDFRYPYEGHLLSKSQGHCGYKLQFLPIPPSRTYLPLNIDQAIRTKELIPLFLKRVAKKIKP